MVAAAAALVAARHPFGRQGQVRVMDPGLVALACQKLVPVPLHPRAAAVAVV